MTTITQEQMLVNLRGFVFDCGTQVEAAKRLDISVSHLNDILHGKRGISKNVAKKFGYELVYEKEKSNE